MRLLILSINYAPEPAGFAPHTTALAEHMAAAGHDVEVVTGFPFAPNWKRWPEYGKHLTTRQVHRGVTLRRVSHHVPSRPGTLRGRLLLEGTFAAMTLALAALRRLGPPDVVLYVGAQPAIAMAARLTSRAWRVPYVVKVTDLAAQAAADVGIVRGRGLLSGLSRFERAAYQGASTAIVLCQAFKDVLAGWGLPPARVHVIPDSIDLDAIRPVAPTGDLRASAGLTAEDFVVLVAGSMGLKQGLGNVVKAAALSKRDEPRVKWVLVGDGEDAPRLRTLAAELDVRDVVRFLPFQPEDAMSRMFADADVLLLNQVRAMKDTVIPSKLLTYLAAGRPVLAAVNQESQAAAVLRAAGGGWVVEPESPEALARAAGDSMRRGEALRDAGQSNRRYAEREFDRRRRLGEQERLLVSAASGSSV